MTQDNQRQGFVGSKKVIYLAGIFDGEGCIYANHNKKGNTVMSIHLVNTNKPLIYWLQREFGGNVYFEKGKEKVRNKWAWRVKSKQIIKILSLMLPYLICKKEQAKLGIALRKSIELNKKGNQYGLIDKNYRVILCEKIRLLNSYEWPAAQTERKDTGDSETTVGSA